MNILRFPERDTPPYLREQVLALQDQAWPGFFSADRPPGHDPALRPLSMLLVVDGRVVASLDILSKQIVHAGQTYAASGLSTVVTDQALRGKGFGNRLVSAARDEIESSGADLGIFTCDTELRPFYESAGWQVVDGAVLVGGTPDAPFPSDQFDKATLAAFFTEPARHHADDFRNSRIDLYPGSLDKLW